MKKNKLIRELEGKLRRHEHMSPRQWDILIDYYYPPSEREHYGKKIPISPDDLELTHHPDEKILKNKGDEHD